MSHTYASKFESTPTDDAAARGSVPRAVQPHRTLQGKCACGGEAASFGACAECQKDQRSAVQLQAASRNGSTAAPPIVHDVLHSPGKPLDAATRTFMEPRFGHAFSKLGSRGKRQDPALAISKPADASEGEANWTADAVMRIPSSPAGFGHDFSRVRIHSDDAAADAARLMNALAFAVGNDVVFASGQYNPASDAGRSLLAHELTHTVQQADGGIRLDRQSADTAPNEQSSTSSWRKRVDAILKTPEGQKKTDFTLDECVSMKDLVQEALEPFSAHVQDSTNSEPTTVEAIAKGWYVSVDSPGGPHVNFDGFYNNKAPMSVARAIPRYPASASGGEGLEVFIVFGPRTLDPAGPELTQATFEHERGHASHYIDRFFDRKPGERQRRDTAGEHLEIYVDEFRRYFLKLWTFDVGSGEPRPVMTFGGMFENYLLARPEERENAFGLILDFYQTEITANQCNIWKFNFMLQKIKSTSDASKLLVERIYAAPQFKDLEGGPIGRYPEKCE